MISELIEPTNIRLEECGFANRICHGIYECGLSNGYCKHKFNFAYKQYCKQELFLLERFNEDQQPVYDGSRGLEK